MIKVYTYIYIYTHMISSKLLLEFPVSQNSRRDSHPEHFGPRLELNDEQMRAKDALKTEEELKSEVPV